MPDGLPRRDGTISPAGAPRYEALFSGRLLTAVVGVGFDEGGAHHPIDGEVEEGLLRWGFRRDDQAALGRLRRGGRPLPRYPGAHFLGSGVVADSGGAPVDAVVTLVRAGDGSRGTEAASAFLDGMDRCDVAIYGGHGRYGSGPDFDCNFTAHLLDQHGEVRASLRDYRELRSRLKQQAQVRRRGLVAHCQLLLKQGRLRIERRNGGNLVINLRNYHADEFGAYLMVDRLRNDPDVRRLSAQRFANRYRVWMFNACRTTDYFYNLRTGQPEANAGGLDLIGTRRLVYWDHMGPSMLGLLSGLLRRHSFAQLLDGLAAHNPRDADTLGPSHVADLAPR